MSSLIALQWPSHLQLNAYLITEDGSSDLLLLIGRLQEHGSALQWQALEGILFLL